MIEKQLTELEAQAGKDLLKEYYETECNFKSDINEHLPDLKEYASKCEAVTELGVRWIVSTWAFLSSSAKKITSIDIVNPEDWPPIGPTPNQTSIARDIAKCCDKDYEFILGDSLDIDIEETDLLLLDTLHRYDQLKGELDRHSDKVKKYLVFHDTTTYGRTGENGGEGILKAIYEFLQNNKNWEIEALKTNNNGLCVLKKKNV